MIVPYRGTGERVQQCYTTIVIIISKLNNYFKLCYVYNGGHNA